MLDISAAINKLNFVASLSDGILEYLKEKIDVDIQHEISIKHFGNFTYIEHRDNHRNISCMIFTDISKDVFDEKQFARMCDLLTYNQIIGYIEISNACDIKYVFELDEWVRNHISHT